MKWSGEITILIILAPHPPKRDRSYREYLRALRRDHHGMLKMGASWDHLDFLYRKIEYLLKIFDIPSKKRGMREKCGSGNDTICGL